LPRTLGEHPELKEPIVARDGRFGPYVQCGSETRSLTAGLSPIDVTFEQAMELLAQPKTNARGARGQAAKKEPIKVFEVSPVTNNPIQLLDGRYGPYVTDGETNASLPKESKAEELTFTQALDLLATRAAMGGGKKKTARRGAKKAASPKAETKAASKKKTPTKKKAAAKKATAKKAAAKKAPVENTAQSEAAENEE
jgi:DNA topoisomerase-1